MVDLIYGTSAFERSRGDFPFLKIVNMFSEEAPTENSVSLISRPGLEIDSSAGAGEVRGIYQVDGVLNNSLVVVSDNDLYVDGVLIGGIDGSGVVSIDGYENQVFICAGASIWTYDGTTLAAIAFPDSANVKKILVAASRLLAIREDTGAFYWSDVLSSTVGALSFATAESSPDYLLDFVFIGSSLILFGSDTVEFWQTTTDDDLPFLPLVGRVFHKGIKVTGGAVRIAGSFAWISNRNDICLDDPNRIISTYAIQEKLTESASANLWVFELDGTEFLALRLDTETWVYSYRSNDWAEFSSYGKDNWLPQCYANGYFGSTESGYLFRWSDDYYDQASVLERTFTAWAAINTGGLAVNNLIIRTTPGHTPVSSGTYSDPVIEMRTSKDGGYTWGPWRQSSMGQQGRYRRLVRWLGLGMFSFPGIMVEFRITDPVPFRVSSVSINEVYGGF